ncbi:MAG TPA: IclR family transcriptional regulator C-terminal domain-containing protein [Croceibacterium sp.]|nr:IclR family transcriptional regulator C-terminal domain-containing protein [Croceibacterium sp.]
MSEDQDRGSGARTVALLKVIAASDGRFTLGQLSAEAGLAPSSAHRLLQPLLRGGLVERAGGQSYQTGGELLRIASLISRQVNAGSLARPILHRLWTQWEETSSLCVYKPAEHIAVVMETIQTPHPLRFAIESFAELSLTWGSLGRAILAALPAADAAAAMRIPGLSPLTGLAPPSPEDMAEVIAEVRANGFAHYRNEAVDAAGIASPVYRADGSVLGSLGLTAPARRMPLEIVPAMADSVKAAADELSAALGYSSPEDPSVRE